MSDPGSAQGAWSVNEGMSPTWADPLDDEAAKSSATQLKLDLGVSLAKFPDSGSRAPVTVETEFSPSELQSLIEKQRDRIHHLECALDQALLVIEELRRQLVNQDFLENQLAATEEVANIQQRAITQLKQQLSQQQHALEQQSTQTTDQAQSFDHLLSEIEALAEGHQQRLVQFRRSLSRDPGATDGSAQAPSRSSMAAPLSDAAATNSSEPAAAATHRLHEQIADLIQQLSAQHATIEQLQQELALTQAALHEQQTRDRLTPDLSLTDSSHLDQELFAAYGKIQDLETQMSRQSTTQAILQHTCQELEQARDRHQARVTELEQQTAEMQEQILKQAQQASEYETAVQHWKDRFLHSQTYLKQLRQWVERSEIPLTSDLADLLDAIQTLVDTPDPDSAPAPAPRPPKIDLPDFLARRQRYRVRP